MNLKDARKLVRRLNLVELEHFAAIGMTFEFNMLEESTEDHVADSIKRRPPMIPYHVPKIGAKRPVRNAQ